MSLQFNPVSCLKVAFLLTVATVLTAQTSQTGPEKKAVSFTGKRLDVGLLGSLVIDHKNSIVIIRCDETPRPSDCNVKK
jgi:hypothetical protein